MAGMLPGVESARRRRFHQGGGWMKPQNTANGRTRRSTFCLYTSNHETYLSSSSFMVQQRNTSMQAYKLEDAAREAKERLDERLRNQWKLQSQREGKIYKGGYCVRSVIEQVVQRVVFGWKKKRPSTWGTTNYKFPVLKASFSTISSEQEELTDCLEAFEGCEAVVRLPCARSFHSWCLVPWLGSTTTCLSKRTN